MVDEDHLLPHVMTMAQLFRLNIWVYNLEMRGGSE